jgi:hypothetical protein
MDDNANDDVYKKFISDYQDLVGTENSKIILANGTELDLTVETLKFLEGIAKDILARRDK